MQHTETPDPIDTTQSLDQTTFAYEEPLFEEADRPQPAVTDQSVTVKSPWYRQPKWLIAVGVITFLLLLILISAAALLNRPQLSGLTEVIESPSPRPELSPLQQRVEEIRVELDAADPAKQDLPFPPLDLELRLDDVR